MHNHHNTVVLPSSMEVHLLLGLVLTQFHLVVCMSALITSTVFCS